MKKIIIAVVVVVLIGVVVFTGVFKKGLTGQQVSKLDPADIVGEFYDQWLKAAQGPLADPNKATLAKSPILSASLRTVLADSQKNPKTPDPVLCQTVIPKDISVRSVNSLPTKTQFLVLSRDKKVTEQAVITLNKLNEGWYIDSISCSPGEFEPEREFSFEKEGNLLKGSVPPPFNSKNWHLVFQENGEVGHVVPLFFDSASECASLDGTKSTCTPDKFTEATKVSIHGQMSERGVNVKRLELLKK